MSEDEEMLELLKSAVLDTFECGGCGCIIEPDCERCGSCGWVNPLVKGGFI